MVRFAGFAVDSSKVRQPPRASDHAEFHDKGQYAAQWVSPTADEIVLLTFDDDSSRLVGTGIQCMERDSAPSPFASALIARVCLLEVEFPDVIEAVQSAGLEDNQQLG